MRTFRPWRSQNVVAPLQPVLQGRPPQEGDRTRGVQKTRENTDIVRDRTVVPTERGDLCTAVLPLYHLSLQQTSQWLALSMVLAETLKGTTTPFTTTAAVCTKKRLKPDITATIAFHGGFGNYKIRFTVY